MYMEDCIGVSVSEHGSQKRAWELLKLGVTAGCEPSEMRGGNQIWVLCQEHYMVVSAE